GRVHAGPGPGRQGLHPQARGADPRRAGRRPRQGRPAAEIESARSTGLDGMDIEQARFNMIEQQIRPWEVLDLEVLSVLSVVRREDFVPTQYKALAFVDTQVPLPEG